MDRLDFKLPDFCRVGWASEVAKKRWSPVIDSVRQLWRTLEIETVRHGVRRVGLVMLPGTVSPHPEGMPAITGLASKPLYSMSPKTMYISDRNISHVGGDWVVHAVGLKSDVDEAVHAFKLGQDEILGRLLGYPDCCIRFFQEVWTGQHYIDTTWPMAVRCVDGTLRNMREFEAPVKAETNLLLRWLGVRPVFHLPCSFHCDNTRQTAADIKEIAKKIGQESAIESLYEMLLWPVQWTALHGIAEIEMPILRISTRTDATAIKYTVRLLGASKAVDCAPVGTRFPYASSSRATNPNEREILLPKRRTVQSPSPKAPQTYLDNGFRSLGDMQIAFEPMIQAVTFHDPRTVLHLACKNGILLHNLVERNTSLQVFGIDASAARIERAKALLPSHAAGFYCAQLSDLATIEHIGPVDVCVLMIGRLMEVPIETAGAVLNVCMRRCQKLIVYAFDDWLKIQSLPDMADKFGLSLMNVTSTSVIACGTVANNRSRPHNQ
jgi:hypothetical protein